MNFENLKETQSANLIKIQVIVSDNFFDSYLCPMACLFLHVSVQTGVVVDGAYLSDIQSVSVEQLRHIWQHIVDS